MEVKCIFTSQAFRSQFQFSFSILKALSVSSFDLKNLSTCVLGILIGKERVGAGRGRAGREGKRPSPPPLRKA